VRGKLQSLKQLKAAYLQQMFPREGERVPRVRFAGFSGDWSERRLGEMTENIATGRSVFNSNTEKSDAMLYAVLGSTSVIGYDSEYDHSGAFILTARVGANAGNLYKYSGNVKISDNTVYIQGKNLDFIYCALLNFDLKTLSFGTGQPLIKSSELKNLQLKFPCDEEQAAIGQFFRNLDELIALHS